MTTMFTGGIRCKVLSGHGVGVDKPHERGSKARVAASTPGDVGRILFVSPSYLARILS